MKLACFQSNLGLRQLDFRTFAQHAADIGYPAVDVPPSDDTAVDFCKSIGLDVHATSALKLPDLSAEFAAQDSIASAAHEAIDIASAQGVVAMTTVMGRDVSLNGDENLAIFKDVFTPICTYAEEKNVKFAFENWPRDNTMFGTTPEVWDAMFNAVPSPSLGLCYDPSHFVWQGIEYIQPIRDFADRIYHAHAKDTEILLDGQNNFGIYGPLLSATEQKRWWRYRLPGFGVIDWYLYVDTLYQIGYDDVLSLEHEDRVWSETPELAERGLELAYNFLQPLMV